MKRRQLDRIDRARGYSHWIDGEQATYLGLTGFLVKKRGLLVPSVPALLMAGEPFWWPDKLQQTYELSSELIFLSAGLLAVSLYLCAYLYAVYRTDRAVTIKGRMHDLLHDTRNFLNLLHARMSRVNGLSQPEIEREEERLKEHWRSQCEVIRKHLCAVYNDKKLGVCVRLVGEENGKVFLTTVGRAGLSNNRERTTERIPANIGLPSVFAKHNNRGVIYVHDKQLAADREAYVLTENDREFEHEFTYVAVAPINSWNGSRATLVGLLFIGSSSRKVLKPKHMDILRTCSDALAVLYLGMYDCLAEHMPDMFSFDHTLPN